MNSAICPLCQLALSAVGRVVAFRDDAKNWFSFDVCHRCTARLDRLPMRLQIRLLDAAIGNLWRRPDRYEVTPHASEIEAKMATNLRAAHLRGEF